MSGWWLVSYVVLWALVATLGVVVLVVLRQLGLIYARDERVPSGPREGDMIRAVEVRDELTGEAFALPDRDEGRSLVLLVSPTCTLCKDALAGIGTVDSQASIVAVSTGDREENAAFRSLLDGTGRLVSSDELHRLFAPPVLPWAVLLDRSGTVHRSHPVDRQALQAMLGADGPRPAERSSIHTQGVH